MHLSGAPAPSDPDAPHPVHNPHTLAALHTLPALHALHALRGPRPTSALAQLLAIVAAAALTLTVMVLLAIPGHSAPRAEEGTARLVLDTSAVDEAEQVVFDFERADLGDLSLSAQLGEESVDVHPSPFGASAVAQPHVGEQELLLTGTAGADLRVVVTYVDAGGTVLTRSSASLSLAATEQPPVVVDPPDPDDPAEAPTPPPAGAGSDVTEGAAAEGAATDAGADDAVADGAATDSSLSVTGVNGWLAMLGLVALAAIAGGAVLVARKRVQA